jgi:hypothetical protein
MSGMCHCKIAYVALILLMPRKQFWIGVTVKNPS